MVKGRSPNYPCLTLSEAIGRVAKVYKTEHTHTAARDVVAKDLGYNTLNGASLTVLGALKRYGLLEDAGDGLRVSANAVALLELDAGDPEHKRAIQAAAYQPSFFSDLKSEYGQTLPSDSNLRDQLIKKGFLPKAANEVIRIYHDNLEFVEGGETPPAPAQSGTISLPVGNEGGKAIFAHVRFDGALRKEWFSSLRGLLEAMEKTLP